MDGHMKARTVFAAILAMAMMCIFISCENDNDQEENDDGNGLTGRGGWPDDLPVCDPFQAQVGWFEIHDFNEKTYDFYDLFGYGMVPCKASVEDIFLTVQCEGWEFWAQWNETDHFFPIIDGQTIFVYASRNEHGGEIWVADELSTTLLYQGTFYWMFPSSFNAHKLLLEGDLGCEYYNHATWPPKPAGEEDTWYRVFGFAVSGYIEDTAYELAQPGQTLLTDDQLYYLIFPYAYTAVVDLLDCDDCLYPHRFLFQAVKSEF